MSEHHKRDLRGVVDPARLCVSLEVERQLLAEEEVLGRQPIVGAQAERHQSQEITQDHEYRAKHH